MFERPRTFWYFVCAFSPRLSPRRLLWSYYELRKFAVDPAAFGQIDRWLLRRMWTFFPEHTCKYSAAFAASTTIGPRLVLPHRLNGIHLAAAAVIGSDCTIMQNVTVGANSKEQAPRIGDRVFLGAAAQIIGRCVIGDDARIGAGVVLTDTVVPPGAVIINKSAYNLTEQRFIYPQD